jgi:transcriptional regulator with XRE-family HTH domain
MPPRKKKNAPPFPELGRNLRDARERCDMSQQDLSTAIGASISSVQRWEYGTMPSRRWWPILEEALAVDRADLLEGEPEDGRLRAADELAALRDEIAEVKAMVAELLER